MLDFPETGQALWRLYDETGIRGEYVLPVLWSESGFDPSAANSLGYEGINQASQQWLGSLGIDPVDYLTWPASQQIARMVAPMYRAIIGQYGAIKSGTRAYQANFLPATLGKAKRLDSTLAMWGDNVYDANAGLDWQSKGTITVGDLAHFIQRAAKHPQVQAAIAHTYALRPGERPRDPVLGEDFGGGAGIFAAAAGIAVLLYAVMRHS